MAEPLTNPVARNSREEGIQPSVLRRSSEQEKTRIQRARGSYAPISPAKPPRSVAANDNEYGAANDNTIASPPSRSTTRAQQQVQALRTLRQGQRPQEQTVTSPQKTFNTIGYTIAFTIATCKDLLDLVGIGSLPLIGWLVTAMASFLIFVVLFTTDSSVSMKSSRRITQRILILLGSVVVEGFFFGLNFLPLEMGAVALMALLDKRGGKLQKVTKFIKYTPIGRVGGGMVK